MVHQGDTAEILVGKGTFAQQAFARFQRAEPAQVRVGNEPAAEHGLSSRIVGGRNVHALGVSLVEPGIPAVPDAQDVRGVAFAGAGGKDARVGGNALVGPQLTLELPEGHFQGKPGEGFGLRGKELFFGNADL